MWTRNATVQDFHLWNYFWNFFTLAHLLYCQDRPSWLIWNLTAGMRWLTNQRLVVRPYSVNRVSSGLIIIIMSLWVRSYMQIELWKKCIALKQCIRLVDSLKRIFLRNIVLLKTFREVLCILSQLFSIKYHYSLPEKVKRCP